MGSFPCSLWTLHSRGSFRISPSWPCWKLDPLLREMHSYTQNTANNFKRVKKKPTWCLSRKLGQEPVIASRASFWAQNRIGIERFMSRSEKVAGGKIQGKDTDSKSERWNSQPYSEALLQQHRVFIWQTLIEHYNLGMVC